MVKGQLNNLPFSTNLETIEIPLNIIFEKLSELINPSPKVYTIEDVAKILQCKTSTVKNLIHRSKELPTCQIGRELRIRDEDLKKFLANRVTPCVYDKGVLR